MSDTNSEVGAPDDTDYPEQADLDFQEWRVSEV